MYSDQLIIRQTREKGRGVFANKRFSKGEIIEKTPVIVIPDPQWQFLEQTSLKEYYFNWSDNSAAIALGYAELYNYCETPNATTIRKVDENIMEFVAIQDIEPGEEITIQYHCTPWFKVI
jgi:uncharacterized protein